MTETLSIKEVAEALGLSRQAIYNKLDKEFKPYLHIVNGKKRLDKAVLDSYSSNEVSTSSDKNLTEIVNLLSSELTQKNKQIEELQEQISKLVEQNKELTSSVQNLTDSLKAVQIVHAQEQKLLLESESSSKKKKFGLFRKNKKQN